MSEIHLIRHGQASFHADDYDQLSSLGAEQSRVLGKYYVECFNPTHLVRGGLKRHCQTLAFYQDAAGCEKGHLEMREFDELDHVEILQVYDAGWKQPAEMRHKISLHPDADKVFEHHFVEALKLWQSGERDHAYSETWQAFKLRVLQGFEDVVKTSEPGSQVLVFTSGGPIAVIVSRILGLADDKLLQINQQLANTGVTIIKSNGSGAALSVFNQHPHLYVNKQELITYR